MAWDHDYRMLNKGEIIRASDEVQNDDGTWRSTICAGQEAPDPAYTSHRVYRRLKVCPVHAIPECMCDSD